MTYEINADDAKKIFELKKYFSKGKRGLIYISEYQDKKFTIKTKNPESFANNTILREYENNKALNYYGVGPKIHYYNEKEDYIIRDFVDGEPFFLWLEKTNNKQKILNVILDLIEQCKRMDDAMINKLEMNHPHKDLLIEYDKPVIIDFERCKKTIKPKNITQLCQFISSSTMNLELRKKGVRLEKKRIIQLAENYKRENEKEKYLEKIKKEIKDAFMQHPSSS